MNERQSIFLGTGLLVLLVSTTAILWHLSSGTSASAAAGETSMAEWSPDRAVDRARDPIPLHADNPISMKVYLTPTCGCCSEWVSHIEEFGFAVELEYVDNSKMSEVKEEVGVHRNLASCHTAVANGYVFEGHVPGEVVREFLAEAPPMRGLAVPGMPVGSPGMEMGDRVDPYDVIAFTSDGHSEVYSSHGSRGP